MILFPSLEEALILHEKVVERFGGSKGVRDLGMLESALYRPQSGYYETLVEMAAALMESLVLNHPFLDGNTRVAFFLTDAFLRLNGFKIKTGPNEGRKFVIDAIVKPEIRFRRIVTWLGKHIVKLS